jgi:hypothetical protein
MPNHLIQPSAPESESSNAVESAKSAVISFHLRFARNRQNWNEVQGCQIVYLNFAYQKSQFGKFWRGFKLKVLVYCIAISKILQTFSILNGYLILVSLVYFVVIWYILSVLVCRTKTNLATLTRWTNQVNPQTVKNRNKKWKSGWALNPVTMRTKTFQSKTFNLIREDT